MGCSGAGDAEVGGREAIFMVKKTGTKGVVGSAAGWSGCGGKYQQIRLLGETHYAHRLAWLYVHGEWPKNDIDHRDGDTWNNRISNLRDVTRSVNNRNVLRPRRNGSSGIVGVSWHKATGKWQANIYAGKHIHLGRFDTKEEAAAAYQRAKLIYHGE